MLRFMGLLAVIGLVGGCVTTGSPTNGGPVPVAKLQAENKSIVIVHTSLHDRPVACMSIQATLAQRDAGGQYVRWDSVTLKSGFEMKQQVPSRVELPAGHYGIVGLHCAGYRQNSNYNTRVAKRGSIVDGSGTVFERPFAEFDVRAGEVVDIGSLRLPSKETPRQMFGPRQGFFIPVVTAIPDEWLKNLAEADPHLYQARVVRPMLANTDCTQIEGNRFRCPVQRPKKG